MSEKEITIMATVGAVSAKMDENQKDKLLAFTEGMNAAMQIMQGKAEAKK